MKLTVATSKLLKMCGITYDLEEPFDMDYNPADIDEVLEDEELPEEAREEVEMAYRDAWQYGTEKVIWREYKSVLGRFLDNFKDFHAEFVCEDDGEPSSFRKQISQRCVGITDYKVGYDNTTIIADTDFAIILASLVDCEGLFYSACSEFMDNPLNFAQSHIHYMGIYFDCYGERKPRLDSVEFDFDQAHFRSEIKRIKKELSGR
jgi:hypothetical protein